MQKEKGRFFIVQVSGEPGSLCQAIPLGTEIAGFLVGFSHHCTVFDEKHCAFGQYEELATIGAERLIFVRVLEEPVPF